MKVLILIADSNSACPVPASKGGAVATLVEHIVEENNKSHLLDLEIVSFYDEKAYELSKKYPYVKFHWIRISKLIKLLDSITFNLVRTLFKKKKAISYRSTFSLITYILKSACYIRKRQFDRIVIENNILLFWIMKLNKNGKKYMGKYYYHIHNVPRINCGCKKEIMNCKKFFCVSMYVKRKIISSEKLIGPIDPSKIEVIQNCIDIDKFNTKEDVEINSKYRKMFGISDSDKVILFVGRLTSEKGIDKVIEAMSMVKSVNTKLLIVGSNLVSGQIKNNFDKYLRQLTECIYDRVIFTGYIKQEEMPYIYNISDVAVLPSMWDEPAGLTMIEAMSCGIPVITTYSGGIPEYASEECSILLERNDMLCRKIAISIDKILNNREYALNISRNAVQHTHNNYGLQKYYHKFVQLLKEDN